MLGTGRNYKSPPCPLDFLCSPYQKGLQQIYYNNYMGALRIWDPRAKEGDVLAQYGLGVLYYMGKGVSRDNEIAIKWWTLAAKKGDAGSQNNLAWMYENGFGVSSDQFEALKWWTEAAKNSYAHAQFNLERLQRIVDQEKRYTRSEIGTQQQSERGTSNSQVIGKTLVPSAANTVCPGTYRQSWNNCIGKRIHHDQAIYVGSWKSGKKHGKGTYIWAKGHKYVGEFKDDKSHGEGTLISVDGREMRGVWKDGQFLYATK